MLILDIARSAVVSHLTPTPDEICPVCKGMVKMHKYSPVSVFMTVGLNLHEHDLSSCVLSASTGYYPREYWPSILWSPIHKNPCTCHGPVFLKIPGWLCVAKCSLMISLSIVNFNWPKGSLSALSTLLSIIVILQLHFPTFHFISSWRCSNLSDVIYSFVREKSSNWFRRLSWNFERTTQFLF